MSRAVFLSCMLPLAFAGCAPGPDLSLGPALLAGGGARNASYQTQIACRERADQVYNVRERAAIYAPGSQLNSPYSSSYQSLPNRGLSTEFEYGRIAADCERETAAESPDNQPRGGR